MADHPNTFHLIIASVGETKFDGPAVSARFPGAAGELTVLPHHESLVTTLRPGTITVKETLKEQTFAVEGGVLEVSGNRAVVLL